MIKPCPTCMWKLDKPDKYCQRFDKEPDYCMEAKSGHTRFFQLIQLKVVQHFQGATT